MRHIKAAACTQCVDGNQFKCFLPPVFCSLCCRLLQVASENTPQCVCLRFVFLLTPFWEWVYSFIFSILLLFCTQCVFCFVLFFSYIVLLKKQTLYMSRTDHNMTHNNYYKIIINFKPLQLNLNIYFQSVGMLSVCTAPSGHCCVYTLFLYITQVHLLLLALYWLYHLALDVKAEQRLPMILKTDVRSVWHLSISA